MDPELLKFEYEVLQKHIHNDSRMAYTILSIMIPASMFILGWLAQDQNATTLQLLSGCIASTLALIVSYGIERRFVHCGGVRVERMKEIEGYLHIRSHLLFGDSRRNSAPLISEVRVHHYFLIYIFGFQFAWLLLLASKGADTITFLVWVFVYISFGAIAALYEHGIDC